MSGNPCTIQPVRMNRPAGTTATLWCPGMSNPGRLTARVFDNVFAADGDYVTIEPSKAGCDLEDNARVAHDWLRTEGYTSVRPVGPSLGSLTVQAFLRYNRSHSEPLRILTPIFIDPLTEWKDIKPPVPMTREQALKWLPKVPDSRLLSKFVNRINEFNVRRGVKPEPGLSRDRLEEFYAEFFSVPAKTQAASALAIARSGGVVPGEFPGSAVILRCEKDNLVYDSGTESLARAFTGKVVKMSVPGTTHSSTNEQPSAWRHAMWNARHVALRLDKRLAKA